MQQIYAYLYRNQLDIFTNYNQSWTQERYRKVYNRNTKIYRNVDNTLDFQIRNGDEKAISTGTQTLVFNLISRETEDLVLQKDCVAVDSTIGRFQVSITETEMQDLELGYYDFSLVLETRNTVDSTTYEVTGRQNLFIDDQYGALGTIEVYGNVTGEIRSSLEIKDFKEVNPAAVGEEDPKQFISGLIDGKPLLNRAGSTHSFQYYMTDYTGSVEIEASLEEGAAPDNWITLDTQNYAAQSLNDSKTITGKYNWFRIVYTPDADNNTGTFDKLLYR